MRIGLDIPTLGGAWGDMTDSSQSEDARVNRHAAQPNDRQHRNLREALLFYWQVILRRVWTRLAASLQQSATYARASMATFAIVEIIGQPLYYYIWQDIYPQPFESVWLRSICVLFSIPMLFERQLSRHRNMEQWLAIYWLFILLFQLPFFFVLMTLLNHLSSVWALSTMAALMLLVILVFDWLMTLILSISGALLAWAVFVALGGGFQVQGDIPLPVLVSIYLFGLVAGSAFNYKSELVAREKLAAITDAVGTMAHELRTPLLGIRSGARGLNAYLPTLIEGYELARQHSLPVRPIRQAHFQQIQSVLNRIHTESEYTSAVLDMLLVNSSRAAIDRSTFESVSIADCVATALERYPFHSTRERDWIERAGGPDFVFHGSKLLMVHVLFNLLKNALYHLARKNGGRIVIWTSRSASGIHHLHFRDTGPGIRPEAVPRIFERFYSGMPRGQGTGIGLAFVRLVIDSFGGYIRCDSVLGEYTEFIMSFPEVADDGHD
ncbi:sensor histidine kinase [Salinisphaera sp. RV14]|uniref:sensor histidine kinase n=2 Tax=unclassified Salinisphaera TaxID=2649847 RepID=UPI003F8706B1